MSYDQQVFELGWDFILAGECGAQPLGLSPDGRKKEEEEEKK